MEIEERLRRFIKESFVYLETPIEIDNSLLTEGLIDSVGLIEIVTYIQGEFGIRVELAEITLENFDTIATIAKFVRGKRTAAERCVPRTPGVLAAMPGKEVGRRV